MTKDFCNFAIGAKFAKSRHTGYYLDLDISKDGTRLGRVVSKINESNGHERDVVRVAAHLNLAILWGEQVSYRHMVNRSQVVEIGVVIERMCV